MNQYYLIFKNFEYRKYYILLLLLLLLHLLIITTTEIQDLM